MHKIANEKVNSSETIDSHKPTKSIGESRSRNWFNIISWLYVNILYSLEYALAFKKVYFPFAYLEKVKRREENYTLKIILSDDLPLLLLAFSWQASNSVLHGISLIFLLTSFWCVYEIGYYENDLVAEKYEQKPKLASTYYAYKQMMETSYPWLWSLVLGWIGIVLLNKAQGVYLPFSLLVGEIKLINPTILFFLSWMVFLACVRYCFKIYNYFNKQARTWLYLILQSLRYYGFLWVTSTNLIGISVLFSHILSRSLLYIVYRYSGGNSNNWPREIPERFLRCCIFIFILITLCFGSQSLAIWQSWQTWAILLWCVIRSQYQIRKTLLQFKPILHDNSN